MGGEMDGYVPVSSHDVNHGRPVNKARTEGVHENVTPQESREAIFDVGDEEEDETH